MALGLTWSPALAEGARTTNDRIQTDITDISDAARQQQLFRWLTPADPEPETVIEAITPAIYDLKDIVKKPHAAIVGETGSGKSFLAQHLIETYFPEESHIVAIDTDASPTDWPGLEVVGRGGNIGAIVKQMSADMQTLSSGTELDG